MLSMTENPVRLFDNVARTSTAVSGAGESSFEFLNRIALPWFVEVRNVLEEWFQRLPPDVQVDVRSRFRSPHTGTADGAFWEMYVHELFSRLGFRLSSHPEVRGSNQRPDYLVEGHGSVFYVECTVAAGSDEEAAADNRLAAVQDALNRMRIDGFSFGFMMQRVGPGSPPVKRLRRDLEKWCHSQDPESVERGFQATGELPTYRWERDGWQGDFTLVPFRPERRRERTEPPIGLFSPPGGWVDEVAPLFKACKAKASRYGHLDRPYVIALLSNRTYVREGHFTEALFGREQVRIRMSPAGRPEAALPSRAADGLWHGPGRQSRVSAVLTARRLRPYTIIQSAPQLWHNPWAKKPLALALPVSQIRVDLATGGAVRSEPALQMFEVFALPPDWPGPDDPWEEREAAGGIGGPHRSQA